MRTPKSNMPLKVKGIVNHISASTWGDAEEIKRWHLARGFNHVGYQKVILNGFREPDRHYISDVDGKIEQGRPDTDVGAHCAADGMNSVSWGICIIGYPGLKDLPKGPDYLTPGKFNRVVFERYMTKKQHESALYANAVLCKRADIDPMGTFKHTWRDELTGRVTTGDKFVISQHSDHDHGKPFCASINMAIFRKQVYAVYKTL
jgi:hypothetical protein